MSTVRETRPAVVRMSAKCAGMGSSVLRAEWTRLACCVRLVRRASTSTDPGCTNGGAGGPGPLPPCTRRSPVSFGLWGSSANGLLQAGIEEVAGGGACGWVGAAGVVLDLNVDGVVAVDDSGAGGEESAAGVGDAESLPACGQACDFRVCGLELAVVEVEKAVDVSAVADVNGAVVAVTIKVGGDVADYTVDVPDLCCADCPDRAVGGSDDVGRPNGWRGVGSPGLVRTGCHSPNRCRSGRWRLRCSWRRRW